jgi:hypothetical protein
MDPLFAPRAMSHLSPTSLLGKELIAITRSSGDSVTNPSDSGRKPGAGAGGGAMSAINLSPISAKQSSETKNNSSNLPAPRSAPHSTGHSHDSRGDTHNDEEDCVESSTARNVQKSTNATPAKDGSRDGSVSRVNYSTTTGPTNNGDSTANNVDDLNDSNCSIMNCTDNTFNNTLNSLDSRQHRGLTHLDNISEAGNEQHTRGDSSPSPSPSPSPAKARFTQFKVPPLTMQNSVPRNRSDPDLHHLGVLYKKNSTGERCRVQSLLCIESTVLPCYTSYHPHAAYSVAACPPF